MNSKRNTIIWAIIACLLWSTAYAGIKLGLKYDTPFHFSGIRFIISGCVILPFTVKPAVFIKMIIDNWKVVAWVTFLQIVVNYSLFYHGLNLVPGAVLSWLLIPEEHPEFLTITGMIIITISLIVYYKNSKENIPVLNN